jgi:LysM repeat protein
MQIKSSAIVLAAFGVGPLLLAAGCGDSTGDGAKKTLSPIQPSSYVTIEPATTTTTTTIFFDPDQPAEGQISPVEQIYVVVPGDSLSKIAALYDISVDVLINYNGWTDGTDHLLLAGDEILIPPNTPIPGTGGEVAAGDDSAPADSGDSSDQVGCTHTIVSGDNPTRVARKYDITVDELSNANLSNPAYNSFPIGDTLNIPPEGNC